MTNRVDTFDRADGVPLGTPSDGGSAWVAYSGTWGVEGNKAHESTGASQAVAALEASVTDADVQITVSGLTGGQDIGLIARLSDNSNYIVGVIGNSDFRIYKNIGGSFTQVGSTYATAPANGDVVTLSVSGTSVALKVNGTTRVSGIATELASNTKYGIRSNSFTINSFDDFSITALGGGTSATANGATLTGTSSISAGSASGTGSASASGATLTGTSTLSAGGASGGGSGSFASDAMENNTGAGLLASTAVSWTWYKGAIGSAPTSTTHGTGTTNSSGILTVSGLPSGAGFLLVRTADSSGVYCQPGTVA